MIVELNAVNVPLGWISIKHLPNEVSAKVCDAICILLCVSLWSKFINNVVFVYYVEVLLMEQQRYDNGFTNDVYCKIIRPIKLATVLQKR